MKSFLSTLLLAALSLPGLSQNQVSTNGNKFVLLEYMTSVGVHFSPDADYIVEQVRSSQPKAICAALHLNYASFTDAMTIPEVTAFNTAYYELGYPMGTINRAVNTYSISTKPTTERTDWLDAINEQLTKPLTYDITLSHTYDTGTRAISVTMTGKALSNLMGDYHFIVYVIEDSVTGTGATYNQRNFYHNQPGHPYFGAGNPIVGYNHMQVVRTMLGGTWGDFAVSFPAANTSTTKTFNYTLPAGYDSYNIRLVGVVARYSATINDREIQNALETKLTACKEADHVQICAVSFDADSAKNIVTWDTTGIRNTTAYNIYRENPANGQYLLLGSVSAHAVPSFTDAIASPNNSYKYKIAGVDSCGREKSLDSSNAHKSISLTAVGDLLQWNQYEGISYTTHNIMKSLGGGPYQLVTQVPYTTTSYTASAGNYRIEIDNTGCGANPITSNYVLVTVGVNEVHWDGKNISLYPNPARDAFHISGLNTNDKVVLTDITGRTVKQWHAANTSESFEISQVNNGVYFVKVYDKDGLQVVNLKLYHWL